MDLGLKGKTAFVAAASQGLGKAVAMRLACEGARVVICARDPDRLEQSRAEISALATGDGAIGLAGDLTNPADIERIVAATAEQTGGIDILINNAGGPAPGLFEELDDGKWQSAFELNLMSAVRLTRHFLPHMRARNWGRVINITSYSVKQPIQQLMLSNSIRLGVVGWSKTLANEVAAEGVLVNCVCPGWTVTDRVTQLIQARAEASGRKAEEVEREIVGQIPMGRMGQPGEFANVVAFLASERASYVTGVALTVDGGTVQAVM